MCTLGCHTSTPKSTNYQEQRTEEFDGRTQNNNLVSKIGLLIVSRGKQRVFQKYMHKYFNDSILLSSYFLTIFLPEIFGFSFFTVPVISTSLWEQLVAKSMTQKKSTHRLTTVYFAKNDLEIMKAKSIFISLKFDVIIFRIFSSLLPCWTSEALGAKVI